MAVGLQRVAQRLEEDRVVVDQEQPQPRRHFERVRGLSGLRRDRRGNGKHQPYGGAGPGRAFDFELGAVPLHHAEHHGQAQARAALALGRVEGFEAAPARFLIHADAGVSDLRDHRPCWFRTGEPGTQRQRAARGHGIHGVENQIGQCLANLAFHPHDPGQPRCDFRQCPDHNAALHRLVAPTRLRQVEYLLHHLVYVHRRKFELLLALAVELAHPGHRLRDVLDRALDRLQIAAGPVAQVRFRFQQRLGVQRHGRKGVVDVVRDAARHLPQRPQPLLLHHHLLCLAQVVVGLLQRTVELRLMGGERHVLAQLPQELTLGAGKTVRPAPRGNQHAEDAALRPQRRHHHRSQSAAGKACRERKTRRADIGLVHQFPPHTAPQPIVVNADHGLLVYRQLVDERLALQADAGHPEGIGRRVVQTDTAKIDRQAILQARHHHLEDALQVLALANRARDVIEQIQMFQLSPDPFLRLLAIGHVPHRADDEGSLRCDERAEAYVHGKFAAIFAPRI